MATTDSREEARIGLVAQADSWLVEECIFEDEHYQVSHETIYRSLYVQALGVLRKSLFAIFARSGRTIIQLVMTRSQNLAPSVCSIQIPSISLVPSGRMPSAT